MTEELMDGEIRKHLISLELIFDLEPNIQHYNIGVIEMQDINDRYDYIEGIAICKVDDTPLIGIVKRSHYFNPFPEELKDKEELLIEYVKENLEELYKESIPVNTW